MLHLAQTTWLDARSEALILDDMMLKLTDDSTPAEDAPATPPSSPGS